MAHAGPVRGDRDGSPHQGATGNQRKVKPRPGPSRAASDSSAAGAAHEGMSDSIELPEATWRPHDLITRPSSYLRLLRYRAPRLSHASMGALPIEVDLREKLAGITEHRSPRVVVPRGAEHRPASDEEGHVPLFGPVGTPNTGERARRAHRRGARVGLRRHST